MEGLQAALEAKADIVLLDNMSLDMMREAVRLAEGRTLLEASGGINEENLLEVAKTGVDYISVGSLTHTISSLDISLDVEQVKGRDNP